jgi:hypothetical protein
MELFTHQVQGRKQRCHRDSPGGGDIGGPPDQTAEQLVIIGVEAGYEKVHNVGDVLDSPLTLNPGVVAHNQIEPRDCRVDLTTVRREFTHIPKRQGSLGFATADLSTRYGQEYR